MKRGTICWVNLEPAQANELGKTRPGIIISNSDQNFLLPTVAIVPLSSRAPEIWPLRIPVRMPDGTTSYAIIPGIRQVSKTRLEDLIGAASDETIRRVGQAMSLYLND
jgi:mRNA-degrading endonuclease toxin of MazEF toxin-antitoxin module